MSNKTYLEIEVPEADKDEVAALLAEQDIRHKQQVSLNLDSSDMVTLVLELTSPILTFLAGLYVARKNSNKHVSYKAGGLEIKGISEEQLKDMLQQHLLPGVPESASKSTPKSD